MSTKSLLSQAGKCNNYFNCWQGVPVQESLQYIAIAVITNQDAKCAKRKIKASVKKTQIKIGQVVSGQISSKKLQVKISQSQPWVNPKRFTPT